MHFPQFCADLSQESEPLFILAIKISKKDCQNPNARSIAFTAVVYFGQVFGFCRLINKKKRVEMLSTNVFK